MAPVTKGRLLALAAVAAVAALAAGVASSAGPVMTGAPTEARGVDGPAQGHAAGHREDPLSAATEPVHRPPSTVTYTFPVAGCRVSYARAHHNYPAADIFADRGCAFVAPTDGRVAEVSRVDHWRSASSPGAARGGRSVSIVGVDGVQYYGSHLEAVAEVIRSGTPVREGQVLGRVGDSGSAHGTGTHLHFGISWPTAPERWWVRRGTVAPQRFLDAWRAGEDLSPAATVRKAKARAGDDSRCRTYC